MAEKPNQAGTTEDEALETGEETAFQRWKRRILKTFGLLLLLAVIVVAGFFAGVYLRVLDVYEVNEKIDLYAIPFIGEYFVEPAKKTPGFDRLEEAPEAFVRSVFRSRADTAVAPMQDILGLGGEARMNLPGTVGGNWAWRMLPGAATPETAKRLKELNRETGRIPVR